jgi:hypothetical protein
MRSEFQLLLIVLAATILGGCGLSDRTTIESPAAMQFPTDADSLDFWDTLETQPVTTNDDALHGLLLFVQYQPPANSWDERIAAAHALGWVEPHKKPLEPLESAQMGFIAVCVCHAIDVQGGLSMRLWGRVPRYCTRELVHMGLIPGITEHEALSGAEFIAVLGLAEQHQFINRALAAHDSAAAAADASGDGQSTAPDQPASEPLDEAPASEETPAEEGETTS